MVPLFERTRKMINSKKKLGVISLAILMVGLHALTGCKDTGKGQAAPEAAELARVKSLLEKTQNERDSLKAKVTEISESLKAAQSKIDTLVTSTGQVMNIEDKLAKVAEEKDAALAKAKDAQTLAENLKSQLQERIKKVAGLEGKNKKLQDMIDELKKSMDTNLEMPSLPEF